MPKLGALKRFLANLPDTPSESFKKPFVSQADFNIFPPRQPPTRGFLPLQTALIIPKRIVPTDDFFRNTRILRCLSHQIAGFGANPALQTRTTVSTALEQSFCSCFARGSKVSRCCVRIPEMEIVQVILLLRVTLKEQNELIFFYKWMCSPLD